MAKQWINYDKPGKGVAKETTTEGFLGYFQIFFRKFWQLCYANLIYLIFFIPVLLLILFLIHIMSLAVDVKTNPFPFLLCFAPIILLAPGNAGIIKVTRDFVREEPGFVWSDFWESARRNLGQSFAVSAFSYIIGCVMLIALDFYYLLMSANPDSFLYKFPFAIACVVCFLFISMQLYLELMVVTLDLKLKLIFKNAILLSFGCLLKNLLAVFCLAIILGLYALIFYFALNMQMLLILSVVIFLLVLFGLLFYTANYFAFPVIRRTIIDPYYKQNQSETAEAVLSALDRNEQETEAETDELPEYVYENGRMVHRSAIENAAVFRDHGQE